MLTLLIWCPAWTQAQGVTTGSVAGTVTDQTGGAVPGARIKLRDEGTKVIKETIANASGGFVFPNLPFGAYEVTVSAPGFQTAVHEGVVVESARATDLNVHLKVGDITETVQVQGAAPVLEQTSNTISNTVRNEAIRNLPLGGRTILNFALLTPGSASVGGNGRNSAYNGMPGATINIMLDGINNNSNGFKSGGTSFSAPFRSGWFLSYPASPGEFGQFIELYGPSVFIPDLSLSKNIAITERVKFNLWATFLNAFNRPVFEASGGVTGAVSIDSTTFGQTGMTFGGGGARTIQIRAGLIF